MTFQFTYGKCGHTQGDENGSKCSVPYEYCPNCSAIRRAERKFQEQEAFKATIAALDRQEYFVPSQEFVESLAVGDLAPCSFSKWAKVVEINYRGLDVNGVLFVHYAVEFGQNASITHSLKVGELNRTIQITGRHNSEELNRIERAMLPVVTRLTNDSDWTTYDLDPQC